ncbi:MAG TPA: AAA family ATPase, partial [Vicinamibacterales bacterium]|nr:AAA family ATPase [Vicinamibacterales bacterium]
MTALLDVLDRADSGDELAIRATQVSRQRTGTHARIEIALSGRVVAYSYLNVDRDEDRVRLANRAHARLGPLRQVWEAGWLQRTLDAWCHGLWERWVAADELEALGGELSPVRYVLEPYVVDGGGTILFGRPGGGKTYLATLWARLIERGDSRFWPVERRPVVYLQLERSAAIFSRRIGAVNRTLGLPTGLALVTKIARGRRLADIADALRSQLQPGTVVFLDSISRAGAGSLKDDETANQIIDTLNSLTDTWVALAHTSHALAESPDAHVYGSVHFGAGADVVVQLVSQRAPFDPSRLGVSLRIMPESNDVPWRRPELWSMRFDERGLCEFGRGSESEWAEIAEARETSTERIIQYLRR